MIKTALGAPLVLCALIISPGLSFGDVIYSDSTFAAANWLPPAFTFIHNDTTGPNLSSVSYTNGPASCASCGAGGTGGLTFTTTSVVSPGGAGEVDAFLYTGYINSLFTWDPGTQGALMTVSGSMEVQDTNTLAPGEPDLDQFAILIRQGGNYFVNSGAFLVNNNGLFNLVTQAPITASSFFQFDPSTGLKNGASHPNFNGSTMEFGLFFTGGTIAPIPPFSETSTFSDLTLDLTGTPEPATVLMVGGGIMGLALLRRRTAR